MASNSQKYHNSLSQTKKNTISLVIKACNDRGLTNKITQAALLAIVSKESDFIPKGEASYSSSSAARIRSVFGSRFSKYTNAEIDVIKKDEKRFFSIIYGDIAKW